MDATIKLEGNSTIFLDASSHLYKRVCASVGNAFFLNSENEELSQKKVERTHLLVDQTC